MRNCLLGGWTTIYLPDRQRGQGRPYGKSVVLLEARAPLRTCLGQLGARELASGLLAQLADPEGAEPTEQHQDEDRSQPVGRREAEVDEQRQRQRPIHEPGAVAEGRGELPARPLGAPGV